MHRGSMLSVSVEDRPAGRFEGSHATSRGWRFEVEHEPYPYRERGLKICASKSTQRKGRPSVDHMEVCHMFRVFF